MALGSPSAQAVYLSWSSRSFFVVRRCRPQTPRTPTELPQRLAARDSSARLRSLPRMLEAMVQKNLLQLVADPVWARPLRSEELVRQPLRCLELGVTAEFDELLPAMAKGFDSVLTVNDHLSTFCKRCPGSVPHIITAQPEPPAERSSPPASAPGLSRPSSRPWKTPTST